MDEHFGPIIKRIDQLFKIRMNQNLQQLDITANTNARFIASAL